MSAFDQDDAKRVAGLLVSLTPDDWSNSQRASVSRLHAFRDGRVDLTPSDADADPMDGAIDRLLNAVKDEIDCGTPQGWQALNAKVSWALNEAFRNGMRKRHVCDPAADGITVEIPGLPALDGPHGWYGRWYATRVGESRVFRITGDPVALAVGRFKASLRKFLGVD